MATDTANLDGTFSIRARTPLRPSILLQRCASLGTAFLAGCAHTRTEPTATPTSRPADVWDTAAPRPIQPRDALERLALERGGDLEFVDRWTQRESALPAFDRSPLPRVHPDARIDDRTPLLHDRDPFPSREFPTPKPATIRFAISRSTYRTREPEEVLSAIQPFIDLTQRDVDVRAEPTLISSADEAYFGLLDGTLQLVAGHVFEYLAVQGWFDSATDNGAVPLAAAHPARPRTTRFDPTGGGPQGAAIELIVAAHSRFQSFADLKGARLAMAAAQPEAPGAFLTRLLSDAGAPADRPFLAGILLRRYAKDAVIDVLKGRADAACVDQGTIGAVTRFYGCENRIRTLAVSPRYHFDVLYTSLNNLNTHRTEIELTQRQLTTLAKDPEGQEVLFFFDIDHWSDHRQGDFDVARDAFADYVRFIRNTPPDLRPLLDPAASVDRRTYDRAGDE